MGAYTSLHGFDSRRHAHEVAPALISLLRDGEAGLAAHGEAGTHLLAILDAEIQRWEATEARHSRHYASRPKGSELLADIKAGLGIDLASDCELLDAELGVIHADVADLLAIRPALSGGCTSPDCARERRCPFTPAFGRPLLTEILMGIFQKLVLTSCGNDPPLLLGKDVVLNQLIDWYSYELGHDDDQAEARFQEAQDELPLLLARLCRRGGIWGWGDGGYGEGLVGWLNPAETRRLADALAAYELGPAASVPTGLSDPYVGEQILPELRDKLVLLREAAAAFAARNLGLLLTRR